MSDASTQVNEEYLDPRFGATMLERLPIFKGFSPDERARIYGLGEIRVFKPQSNVIIEGENTSGFYIILEGIVAVYKAGRAGLSDHRLASLGQGKAFGEMSLIDRKPRSATVVAEAKSILFHLDGDTWGKVLEDDAHAAARFYQNFAYMLSNRLRELDEEFILSQKQLWKFALRKKVS
ncbi:MAG: cyclic nucleotide-binding domain-containing protein [Silvanigrellales bacterium]|jgi:CRP-like cAMP-binding protein|nr:cyclic nucleotide-binding domain-containing protein [Silvanigrellales bacterium]